MTEPEPNVPDDLPEDVHESEPEGAAAPAPDADLSGDEIPDDVDNDPALQGDAATAPPQQNAAGGVA